MFVPFPLYWVRGTERNKGQTHLEGSQCLYPHSVPCVTREPGLTGPVGASLKSKLNSRPCSDSIKLREKKMCSNKDNLRRNFNLDSNLSMKMEGGSNLSPP